MSERQVHVIDVPEGATVVGIVLVYVDTDGNVGSSVRVQAGTDKRNAQAFYTVVARSLEDFRRKRGLDAGDGGFEFKRVDN